MKAQWRAKVDSEEIQVSGAQPPDFDPTDPGLLVFLRQERRGGEEEEVWGQEERRRGFP